METARGPAPSPQILIDSMMPVAVAQAAKRPRGAPGTISLDSLLASLSLREKIGQLIMPWLAGAYAAVDASPTDFVGATVPVESLGVGGVIVSVGSPLDVAAKLNQLQRRSKLPLLVTADLEGGGVTRLIGATALPPTMAVGATGRELDAYQMGRVTALEARAVGIHWSFSPVADVNNNPANPIINTRSFGEDPKQVATLVAAYVRGAQEHGLFTTAKHFPGHGDTGIDSHIDVPVVSACWGRLDTLELTPFRAAITAGVTATMTAHVAVPCVTGDSLPATLEPAVMTGVLRDSLHFRGLVVTDALQMGAVVRLYGAGEAAVRSFLAGSDLLLMPQDVETALGAMTEAVRSGRIPQDRVDQSVRRLLALKIRAGLFAERTVPLDSVPARVGRKESQAIADDIAARALTLVLPGSIEQFRSQRGRTTLITYAEETNLSIGGVLWQELATLGDTVSGFRLYPSSGVASYDSARTAIGRNGRVVFAASVRPIAGRGNIALPDPLADLIEATSRVKATVLASFGSPYLLNQLPGFAGAYLLAYADVVPTERAVARALAGGSEIAGRVPITISPQHPRGFGIHLPARPAGARYP